MLLFIASSIKMTLALEAEDFFSELSTPVFFLFYVIGRAKLRSHNVKEKGMQAIGKT
jgi:hypothetical protein